MRIFTFIVYGFSLLCAVAMVFGIWLSPVPPDRVLITVWVGISICWLLAAFINDWKLNK